MTYTTVTYCGNDHTVWLNSIDFYKNEFDTLEKRLVEVAGKNNGSEIEGKNQFIVTSIQGNLCCTINVRTRLIKLNFS